MEKLTFTATNIDGKVVEYEAIATYEDNNTNKSYILYTDKSRDKEGKLRIFSSLFKKNGDKLKLIEITNQEDKEIVNQLLLQLTTD
jgi:uncharacterized protein YrzB (UPF0473 family)